MSLALRDEDDLPAAGIHDCISGYQQPRSRRHGHIDIDKHAGLQASVAVRKRDAGLHGTCSFRQIRIDVDNRSGQPLAQPRLGGDVGVCADSQL